MAGCLDNWTFCLVIKANSICLEYRTSQMFGYRVCLDNRRSDIKPLLKFYLVSGSNNVFVVLYLLLCCLKLKSQIISHLANLNFDNRSCLVSSRQHAHCHTEIVIRELRFRQKLERFSNQYFLNLIIKRTSFLRKLGLRIYST